LGSRVDANELNLLTANGVGDVSEGRHRTRFVGDIAAGAQVVAPISDRAVSRNGIGDLGSKAS